MRAGGFGSPPEPVGPLFARSRWPDTATRDPEREPGGAVRAGGIGAPPRHGGAESARSRTTRAQHAHPQTRARTQHEHEHEHPHPAPAHPHPHQRPPTRAPRLASAPARPPPGRYSHGPSAGHDLR